MKDTAYLDLIIKAKSLPYKVMLGLMILQFNISLLNSFLASGDFCRLLITFAKSLNPDQDQQIVGADLDPNCLKL